MFRGIVIASVILLFGVSASADDGASVTLPNVPAAFHLVFFDADRLQMAPGAASILDPYDAQLLKKLSTVLPGVKITQVPLANTDPATMARACVDDQAIGVVLTGSDWPIPAPGAVKTISTTVAVGIYDCHGEAEWGAKESKSSTPSTVDHSVGAAQIAGMLDDLSDQVIADIHDITAKPNPTRLENFLKYGYAVGTGERRPYFGLQPDPAGARVTYAFVFGSAARAGLKPGDLVTAINGQPTIGLSQDRLNSTLLGLMSPPNNYALDVQAAEGSKTTVRFEAQDLQWYLAHPTTAVAVSTSPAPTPSPGPSIDPVVAQMEALLLAGDDANRHGDATTALLKYQEALALARQTGNRGYEARSLGSIGGAELVVGRYADALSNLQAALAIARQLGMRDAEAGVLGDMGIVLKDTGHYEDALSDVQQALTIDRQLGRSDNEQRALGTIADIEQRMSRYDDSLEAANEELAIAVQRQDLDGQAGAHLAMGNVMTALSRFPEALGFYRLALDAYRALKNPQGEAHVLGNIGLIQTEVGQYADALESHEETIALARQAGDPPTEAKALNDIANVQAELGLYQAALRSNGDALEIQRKIGDPTRIANTLTTRGFIEKDLAAYADAESYFRQALDLSTQIADQAEPGYDLIGLGSVQASQGRYAEALASYQRALAVFVKLGDQQDQADILWSSATVQQRLHLFSDALVSAQRSSVLLRATGSPVWHALYAAAQAQASLDDPQDALANYEAAIDEIEQLRGALPEAGSRTSFFVQALPVYDNYIAYLLDLDRRFPGKGYDRKAFEIFERRQGRTLLEQISQSAAHGFSGVPLAVSQQENTITVEIAQLKSSLAQARSTSQADAKAIAALETELSAVEQRRDALEASIKSRYPAYYALQHPQPIAVSTLQQRVLRPGEAMLVYDVLGNRTALWIITPTAFQLFELEGGAADVQHKVDQYLSAPRSVQSAIDSGLSRSAVRRLAAQTLPPFVDASSALYQWLFPAAARSTISASKVLYVVPTGALYGAPFEALVTQTGSSGHVRYLVEDVAISYLPSASLLGVLREGAEKQRQTDQQPLVAFANPTFARTTGADSSTAPTLGASQTAALANIVSAGSQTSDFPALPGSEIEAKAVAATIKGSIADIYLHDDASVATVNRLNANGDLKHFRYVLFATHAALPDTVSGVAQPSLVLAHPSAGGFLTMGDVYGLSLDAQLVMLSACESGGGVATKGEGVQGLTQAFMYAGTPVVSVTQWEVVDDVAERFTPDFFFRMHNNATPAQALRAAKLAMIRGSDAMLQHPFFWAPTVLFGDGAFAPGQ